MRQLSSAFREPGAGRSGILVQLLSLSKLSYGNLTPKLSFSFENRTPREKTTTQGFCEFSCSYVRVPGTRDMTQSPFGAVDLVGMKRQPDAKQRTAQGTSVKC